VKWSGNFGLYINTLKYLKPAQILAHITKKLPHKQKSSRTYIFFDIPTISIKGLDDDTGYLGRFDISAILHNEIRLLHETHKVDLGNWSVEGNPRHLWLFNLQYMEYLVPMAAKYLDTGNEEILNKIFGIMESWIDCHREMEGDAWQSYTISLRIPNWFIVMDMLWEEFGRKEGLQKKIADSIYRQYGYLKTHQETHLLGNHYFENLKCLLLCSLCFHEKADKEEYKKMLLGQCREQILPDGMHFERSFMYHKIILEDILRLIAAMDGSSEDAPFLQELFRVAGRMLCVEASFEVGINRTLLFNDAGDNVSKYAGALIKFGRKLEIQMPGKKDEVKLPYAGYYLYRRTFKDSAGEEHTWQMVIDCGEIGPSYNPGHGHCDCLSYEVFIDEEPLIVNSGTYQYQDKLRGYFRSTEAHNAFTIDGMEQSQCWDEHRVAKRIKNISATVETDRFEGGYTDYKGQKARRLVEIKENAVTVADCCMDKANSHTIESFIHVAPIWKAVQLQMGVIEVSGQKDAPICRIQFSKFCECVEQPSSPYAEEFGKLEYANTYKVAGSKIKYRIIFS